MKKLHFIFALLLAVVIMTACNSGDGFIESDTDTTVQTTINSEETTAVNEQHTEENQTHDSITATESESSTENTTTEETTTATTTTDEESTTESVPSHLYTAFTAEEKKLFERYIGEVIPFIPNDGYYVEGYYEETDYENGMNFYAFGNTKAEFDAYLATFAGMGYEFIETYEDDYGDTWYYYCKNDNIHLDVSFYYYEGYDMVDIYVYSDTLSSDGEGSDEGGDVTTPENRTYTDFTDAEKALFEKYIGDVVPFIPNDEYYVEGYYEEADYENGMNFYAFGNTKAEFDAYLATFAGMGYEFIETYEDDYGDTWFYYCKNDNIHLDVSFYHYEGYDVVDMYVYSDTLSSDGEDGGEGGGSVTVPDEDLLSNKDAGLPEGTDGVYNVDLNDAEYAKNVTEQGYYIGGCPTVGSPAVLVIPVDFSDVPASANANLTIENIKLAMTGNAGDMDYYSLWEYYYTSSYGQLDLDITVIDSWFRPQFDSEYYANATMDYYDSEMFIGDQMILDEALAYYSTFMDLSQFDSDGNGIIDSVILVNTLEIDENSDFNWAYRYWNLYTDTDDNYYEYDGVSANDYIWMSYYFMFETDSEKNGTTYDDYSSITAYTFIHEFAHVLGVDDYYDTSYSTDTDPMGDCDIMSSMLGDHNAFTKFHLGWLTSSRLVVTDSTLTLELEAFAKSGDTIIIANNWNPALGAYQEYCVIAYYTNGGLNDEALGGGYFVRDGVVVYHVNSTLFAQDYDGETYYDIYNNNTDSSDEYGTVDNLIEYVRSAADTYTYVEGDRLPTVTDDNGNKLGITFTVESLTDSTATLVFTKI